MVCLKRKGKLKFVTAGLLCGLLIPDDKLPLHEACLGTWAGFCVFSISFMCWSRIWSRNGEVVHPHDEDPSNRVLVPVRVSRALEISNSDWSPKLGLMCFGHKSVLSCSDNPRALFS